MGGGECSPLVNLLSLLSTKQDAIIAHCSSNLDNFIISLLLTNKKDLLLLKLEKASSHNEWSKCKSKLYQVEWFENVSNKGVILGLTPDNKKGIIVTERFNIYTFDFIQFLESNNENSDEEENIQNFVKQVFIGPQKPSLPCSNHIVSWTNHEDHVVLAAASVSGHLTLVNITKGSLVGKMQLEDDAKMESMHLYHDDAKDCYYLIFKSSENYLRLLVEQKSLGYTWSGGKNSESSGQHNTHLNTEPFSLPDIVESRGRLSSIKQMSVGKITNLRNRIAEGRKLLRSKSESEDLNVPDKPISITTEVGMNSLVSVESCDERDVISTFYPALFQFLNLDANLEPVQQSTRWLPSSVAGSIRKLCRHQNICILSSCHDSAESIHMVTALTGNKTQNSVLQSICLPPGESVLSLLPLQLVANSSTATTTKSTNTSINNNNNNKNSSPKSSNQKNPFKNLVCVTTDENGESKTQVLKPSQSQNCDEDSETSEDSKVKAVLSKPMTGCKENFMHKFVDKEVDSQRKLSDTFIASYLVVTTKQVYILSWVEHPVDSCIQQVSESDNKHNDQLLKVFGLEKAKIQELSGDLKLCSDDYSGAKNQYKLAGLSILKIALKLAVFGCVSELLAYLQVVLNNRNIEATHREKVHLSNLALISYHQQMLKLGILTRQRLQLKFLHFLQENKFYDKQLMVTQGVNSEAWSILLQIIPGYGLETDLTNDLVNWMEKITQTNSIDSQFGAIMKHYLGSNWDSFISLILQSSRLLLNAIGLTKPGLANFLKSFIPYLTWSQLSSLASLSDPRNQEILYHLQDGVAAQPFAEEALDLHLSCLLHLVTWNKQPDLFNTVPNLEDFSNKKITRVNTDCDNIKIKEQILCCGYSHVVYHNEGNLTSWGSNNRGATGGQPSYSMYFPPSPLNFFSQLNIKVLQVSCGKYHTISLTSNGLYSWGCNQYGQLGLGDHIIRTCQPQRIDLDNITQIACGQFHNVALDSEGQVYTWGWGVHGQLGHNSIDSLSIPKKLNYRCINNAISQVAAGYAHTLMLSKRGVVWACGLGMFGQLGTGAVNKSYTPTRVNLPAAVNQISAGYFFSLACAGAKTLFQWGSHPQILRFEALQRKKGLLPTVQANKTKSTTESECEEKRSVETGETVQDAVPAENSAEAPISITAEVPQGTEQHLHPVCVDTSEVIGSISSMSCGSQHLLITTSDGGLYTWGRNLDGQLGHGGRAGLKNPTRVAALQQDVIVAACCGSDFIVAVTESGGVLGWGSNGAAQLGKPPLDSGKSDKGLLMKTSKRILRLQQGLQNSCDVPKPIPGITKADVYGGKLEVNKMWPATDFHYFRKPSYLHENELWSLPDCEQSSIRHQQCLFRTLQTFHDRMDKKMLVTSCLSQGNLPAAILVLELEENYKQAYELTLKCLMTRTDDEVKSSALETFYKYVRAVHGKQDFRNVQTCLFTQLINFWNKRNFNFSWLEDELLVRSSPADVGSLVYILFCSPTQQSQNGSEEKEDSDARPLDHLSPEFLLKLGQQFTKVSQKIGISSRVAEGSNGSGSSAQQSLKQILDSMTNEK